MNDKKNGITKNYQEPATIKKERCGASTCERERENMSSVSKVWINLHTTLIWF